MVGVGKGAGRGGSRESERETQRALYVSLLSVQLIPPYLKCFFTLKNFVLCAQEQ